MLCSRVPALLRNSRRNRNSGRMAEDDEGEIPVWRARMPGDPEIDREVKSGEEKLWEAVYDNDHERVEQLLHHYAPHNHSQRPAAPPERGEKVPLDLDWRCTPRRGIFVPPHASHNGWTAFHVACAYGKISGGKVVEQLLEAGVDVDVLNRLGRTGWDLAQMNSQGKVLQILNLWASGGTIGANGPSAGSGTIRRGAGMRAASHSFDPGLTTHMIAFDTTFDGRFDTSATGKLYDQKREHCTSREVRAPLADTAFWGGTTDTPLQELEEQLGGMQAKVRAMPAADAGRSR
eukprot:COSAG01_NODE_12787_length_1685_cov_7.483607_1_plen_290_part_00